MFMYYSMYCSCCQALPSQISAYFANECSMQCKQDRNWLFVLEFKFSSWGCWFSHVYVNVEQSLANILIPLFLCYKGKYWSAYSEHSRNGRCAEDSWTGLAVDDTALFRGRLIFPVNPVSLCRSCQEQHRKRVTQSNWAGRQQTSWFVVYSALAPTLFNYSNFTK